MFDASPSISPGLTRASLAQRAWRARTTMIAAEMMDELRIYDRMLSDDNIASLARNETPQSIPPIPVTAQDWQKDWWFRYGWNRAGDMPAPLPSSHTIVRKIEIHDAYDLKRWWWKGTDGIRETTWPGVYNRSRLVGRFDYFQLPDWDCYSLSGKSVTFYMPNEPWESPGDPGEGRGAMCLYRRRAASRAERDCRF